MNSNRLRIGMTAVLLLIGCLVSVNSARAGESYEMQVTVPFDFYVGDHLMPAGNYNVFAFDNVVRFNNTISKAAAGIQTLRLNAEHGAVTPLLTFNKYGEDYFLHELWWGQAHNVGSMTMTTRREVEIAKTGNPIRIEARAQR